MTIIILTAITINTIQNQTADNKQNTITTNNQTTANNQTIQSTNTTNQYTPQNNESTIEVPALTIQDEQNLEDQEIEDEGFELQGEIKYEDGTTPNSNILIGNYSGITYFNQVDPRWKNKMYSSTGNTSQTIGNSGCGPTSASIIVSSIKGTVTPDVMATAFVENGYRSANNGTYWSAFRWVSDEFDIGYTETYDFNRVINLVKNENYMAVVSVGNGLFTTGGHFVVIYGIDGNTLKIYDPFLYSGKFDISTRRGKVTVNGNTILCSVENFKNYANAKGYFLFHNSNNSTNNNVNAGQTESYTKYVNAKIGLNIRNSPNGTIVGALANNTKVTVYETSGNWSRIDRGWVSSNYLSSSSSNGTSNNATNTILNNKYTTGTYKVNASALNVRTGPGNNYRIKNFYELTVNARSQGGYVRNVRFSVLKVSGEWGLSPSGWVCLRYCLKI